MHKIKERDKLSWFSAEVETNYTEPAISNVVSKAENKMVVMVKGTREWHVNILCRYKTDLKIRVVKLILPLLRVCVCVYVREKTRQP